MQWWDAISNLLAHQATRTITGAGTVARAVAVADESSSGLSASAPAALSAAISSEYEREPGIRIPTPGDPISGKIISSKNTKEAATEKAPTPW